jgi:hypothetical protein
LNSRSMFPPTIRNGRELLVCGGVQVERE